MNKILERLAALTSLQVLIGGVLLGAFYFYTSFDDGSGIDLQLNSVMEEVKKEEVKKKDVDATLAEKSRMEKSLMSLGEQYSIVTKLLPSNLSSIEVNRSIDQFATNSGVNIKNRKPGTPIPREVVEEVPVDVTLEGTYSELTHFMYMISSIERLTRVGSFALERTVETKDNGKLKFIGSVIGYRLAPSKDSKAGDSKSSKRDGKKEKG